MVADADDDFPYLRAYMRAAFLDNARRYEAERERLEREHGDFYRAVHSGIGGQPLSREDRDLALALDREFSRLGHERDDALRQAKRYGEGDTTPRG